MQKLILSLTLALSLAASSTSAADLTQAKLEELRARAEARKVQIQKLQDNLVVAKTAGLGAKIAVGAGVLALAIGIINSRKASSFKLTKEESRFLTRNHSEINWQLTLQDGMKARSRAAMQIGGTIAGLGAATVYVSSEAVVQIEEELQQAVEEQEDIIALLDLAK